MLLTVTTSSLCSIVEHCQEQFIAGHSKTEQNHCFGKCTSQDKTIILSTFAASRKLHSTVFWSYLIQHIQGTLPMERQSELWKKSRTKSPAEFHCLPRTCSHLVAIPRWEQVPLLHVWNHSIFMFDLVEVLKEGLWGVNAAKVRMPTDRKSVV